MSSDVLIVEDDGPLCRAVSRGLAKSGIASHCVATAEQGLAVLRQRTIDVVLTDLHLDGMNGLEMCKRTQEIAPGVPVIVMTGFGNFDAAVAAIRAGAYDFLSKPIDIGVVSLAVERAIVHRGLIREVTRLRDRVEHRQGFGEIVGSSAAMERVYDLIARAAESDATVLITGESGTGKELVARAMHRRSRRCGGPFVAINCAALSEPLLESELFGHTSGAFTDARDERTGVFVHASGGSLFLDEVGDMSPAMQVKLLRALQERCVRPVGGDREIPYDARIIAATNRDLDAAFEEGRFRSDLYFRINVIHIEVPTLRERRSDILLLAQHFTDAAVRTMGRAVRGISPEAADKLMAYDWPGNVRELQNCIDRAVVLTRFDHITADDLPERIRFHRDDRIVIPAEDPSQLVPLEEVERRYIMRTLEATKGNRTRAARILGLDRKTLRRKLARWESDV